MSDNRFLVRCIIGVAVVLFAAWFFFFRPITLSLQTETLEAAVIAALAEQDVAHEHLVRELREDQSQGRWRWQEVSRTYNVPANFDKVRFEKAIDRQLSASSFAFERVEQKYRMAEGALGPASLMYHFRLAKKRLTLYKLFLNQPQATFLSPDEYASGKTRVAIVLDDWGYNANQQKALETIQAPLTIAVLPHLRYSTRISELAHANGHEVILHMPMEAKGRVRQEQNTLLVGMPEDKIEKLFHDAVESIPYLVGFSNHQGSLATANRGLMEQVLKQAKGKGLYFLDSYVSADSVGVEVAQSIGIPYAKRSVFIDNEQSEAAIEAQLKEVLRQARNTGTAIAIGHDRPATLLVLEKRIPAIQAAGYTIVPASELLLGGES